MAANALLTKTVSADVRALPGPARESVEIDRVAALLREQHPGLEIWHPELQPPRTSEATPAWLVIGGIWAATLVLIDLVFSAVIFLLA